MHVRTWFLLLLLLTGVAGCMQTFRPDATTTSTRTSAKVQPMPVSPEQVDAKNAHDQALALWNELDWDERHARKK